MNLFHETLQIPVLTIRYSHGEGYDPSHSGENLNTCDGPVQLLDFLVQISMAQLEILRVAASIIVPFWLRVFSSSRWTTRPRPAAGAIGLYLILNLVFISREGLTHPEQAGGLRIGLFVSVFLTAALSALLVSLRSLHPAHNIPIFRSLYR